MTPVCPFVKAAPPEDVSARKVGENQNKHMAEQEGKAKESGGDSTPKCPFGYDAKESGGDAASKCPFGFDAKESVGESAVVPPKCPFGYDSQTFKLGPLSCMICQALLFDCSKCVPCSHVYCKACILRFKDCPLCGLDIEKIEANTNLQGMVDRFIEGHARIKRPRVTTDKIDNEEVESDKKTVIYEDVSLERGAFLVQQSMRAFRAQNFESAKSRLSICAEDIRDQLERKGNTPELCSQLGAVLGMLGDCCRVMGDADAAVTNFEESVDFLLKFPSDDLEVAHTLSVSLNKVGDLKYYEDLQAARSYYFRSLNIRRDSAKCHPNMPSQISFLVVDEGLFQCIDLRENGKNVLYTITLLQEGAVYFDDGKKILDVAVSLAKVADIDRSLGNEDVALDGFQEAVQLLSSLTLKAEEAGLEQRRKSVLEFLNSQVTDKQSE